MQNICKEQAAAQGKVAILLAAAVIALSIAPFAACAGSRGTISTRTRYPRTKAALASGGRLRGMLWHQAEADSWAKETAETYAVRLTNMVTQLRRDLALGLPDTMPPKGA